MNEWGPHVWAAMHYIALGYPDDASSVDKVNYAQFYKSLYKVLPCITCANHYEELMRTNDVTKHMASKETLFAWTVEIHNAVNKRLGKREWSVEEALIRYTESQEKGYIQYWLLFLIVVIIGLAVVAYLFSRK